jgi:hypothetical protein
VVAPTSPSSGGPTLDLDTWSLWWRFNREPYVEVTPWAARSVSGEDARRTSSTLSTEVVHDEIVPALRAALEEDPSVTLRSALLFSLARIGDRESTALGTSELHDTLVDHLDHPNANVAETACIGIGILARPSSLPTLSALYLDTEAGQALVGKRGVPLRLRAFAAYGIGLLGERTDNPDVRRYATHTLVDGLAEEPGAAADERVAAVVALGTIGGSGRPATAEGCACASNDGIARRLFEVLEARGETVETRAHVPRALARLAPHVSDAVYAELTGALLEAATSGREKGLVSEGSILALGALADADEDPVDVEVRERLTELASEGNHRARSFALLALAQVGAREGRARADGTGDPRAGTAAIQRTLVQRLARARSQDEPWAALALGVLARGLRDRGELPSEGVLAALREGLRGAKSPDEKAAYAIAIGLSRDYEAHGPLVARVDELDPSTRSFVALALGMTGAPAAIEPLQATLAGAEHEPETLVGTAHALALLKDPALLDALEAVGEDCECALSHLGTSLALGRSRHPGAAALLLARLQDAEAGDLERTYAAIGLGYLAEKDALPWSARISAGLQYRAHPGTLTSATQGGILDLP